MDGLIRPREWNAYCSGRLRLCANQRQTKVVLVTFQNGAEWDAPSVDERKESKGEKKKSSNVISQNTHRLERERAAGALLASVPLTLLFE